jgi:hypothetical protein
MSNPVTHRYFHKPTAIRDSAEDLPAWNGKSWLSMSMTNGA